MTYQQAGHMLAFFHEHMPKKWPKPRLVLHESPEAMVEFVNGRQTEHYALHGYSASLVQAIADPEKCVIHTCQRLLLEEVDVVADVLLHELGHLRHAQRGIDDTEKQADDFARRWYQKLKDRVPR